MCYFLTVLVYAKTTFHLNVGSQYATSTSKSLKKSSQLVLNNCVGHSHLYFFLLCLYQKSASFQLIFLFVWLTLHYVRSKLLKDRIRQNYHHVIYMTFYMGKDVFINIFFLTCSRISSVHKRCTNSVQRHFSVNFSQTYTFVS